MKTNSEKDKNETLINDKTFIVKIKYNQNNSIQGTIQWVEQKKAVNFRSMMELMMLMNESLENKEIRSWEGDEGAITLVQSISNS